MQICKWTMKKIPTCSDSALLVDKKSIKVIQVNNFQSLFRLHFLSYTFHGNSSTQQYCHEEFPRKLSYKSVNKSVFLKIFNLYSHLFYHLKYTNSHFWTIQKSLYFWKVSNINWIGLQNLLPHLKKVFCVSKSRQKEQLIFII